MKTFVSYTEYTEGHIQNANECFNSKHLISGFAIVEIASYSAAGLFNDGYNLILRTMSTPEIIIGKPKMLPK